MTLSPEEQARQIFRKQDPLPDGRYMPESPHFNNEGAVQHFDFKDEKKSGDKIYDDVDDENSGEKQPDVRLVVINDTLNEATT